MKEILIATASAASCRAARNALLAITVLASAAAHADCSGPAPGCEIMNQRYHANDPQAAPSTEPYRAGNPMVREDNGDLGHNPNPEGNGRE